jgi:hypothetical protein
VDTRRPEQQTTYAGDKGQCRQIHEHNNNVQGYRKMRRLEHSLRMKLLARHSHSDALRHSEALLYLTSFCSIVVYVADLSSSCIFWSSLFKLSQFAQELVLRLDTLLNKQAELGKDATSVSAILRKQCNIVLATKRFVGFS